MDNSRHRMGVINMKALVFGGTGKIGSAIAVVPDPVISSLPVAAAAPGDIDDSADAMRQGKHDDDDQGAHR